MPLGAALASPYAAVAATYFEPATILGGYLAKPNYQFEKRQRDLAKKAKQEEKRRQKLAGKTASDASPSSTPEDTEATPAETADK